MENKDACNETLEILSMFKAIHESIAQLDDKREFQNLKFKGFDLHHVPNHIACAKAIASSGKVTNFRIDGDICYFGDDSVHFKSAFPLETYRKMLEFHNSIISERPYKKEHLEKLREIINS